MTLSSKLIFLSVILVPCFLSLKGEILNLEPDYQGVLEALDFAMNKLNDKGSNVNRFMSTKVQEATLQVVSGRKFCNVSEIGNSRRCRNDKAHKSASLDTCPIDALESKWWLNMASEAERDEFEGARSSSAPPALRFWLPLLGGDIEAYDGWTARILAIFIPIAATGTFLALAWILTNCFSFLMTLIVESRNRNAAQQNSPPPPAVKSK